MTSFDHYFVHVDDRRMHYVEAGHGDPLLLLHSGGASAYEYEHVIPLLARTHRVIAWDMPGHGDGDRIVRHFAVEDHRRVLAGFIKALDLRDVTVVGASFGGYIALDYACQPNHWAKGLVIVEAPLRSPQWYIEHWAMFEAMCAVPQTPIEQLMPRFRTVTDALHARWTMDRLKAGSWTIVDLAWAARDFDAAAAFRAAQAPISVILGANGPTIAEQSRLTELRPEAGIFVLADCGHFPMIDDPEHFAAGVRTAVS